MLFAVALLLYSYHGSVDVWLSPAIPVKPENEALEMNDSVVSIELPQNLTYAPHNLPFLDPTLPFVGRESDVRNVTDNLVSNQLSIVGISGSPAFGKSTLAIHIGSGAHRAGEAGEGACDYYRRRNSNMAAGC